MIPSNYGGPEDLVVQAVMVCVNYADYLAETLPVNLPHFDHLVVVTDRKDRETQALCRRHSVQCVVTDDFYVGGDNFNKGRGINLGLAHLLPGGWRLHLDADVALPTGFRRMLRKHPLDRQALYGADRVNVYGRAAWEEVRGTLPRQYNLHYLVTAAGGPATSFGSRFVHGEWGYCPIGFFQMWHSSVPVNYPVNQGSAAHTDVMFATQWPRERRHLVPEMFVYHLEGPRQLNAANWHGRKTPRFGATDNQIAGAPDGDGAECPDPHYMQE